MSHLHGDSSGMDGREIADLMWRPHVPPEPPPDEGEAKCWRDTYDSVFGTPALRAAREEAFYDGYQLAMKKGRWAGDIMAGIAAGLRDGITRNVHARREEGRADG